MLIHLVLLFVLGAPQATGSNPPTPGEPKTSHEPEKKPRDEQHVAKNDKDESQSSPLPPPVGNTIINNQSTVNQYGGDKDSSQQWWMIIFSGALVVVGYLQWRTLRKQTGIINKQVDIMNEGLAATKEAANAAKEAAQIAGRSLRISSRAWVSINVEIGKIEVGRPLLVKATFRNVGKTPALRVQTGLKIELVNGDGKSVVASFPEEIFSKDSFIMPNSSICRISPVPMNGQNELSQQAYEDISGWKKTIVAYGKVRYRDVHSTEHWTTFNVRFDVKSESPNRKTLTGRWGQNESGNETDDNDEQPIQAPKIK